MNGTPRRSRLRVVSGGETDPAASSAASGGEAGDRRKVAIEIQNASLQYPIAALTRGSLKSALFSLFGHREKRVAGKYVEAICNLSLQVGVGERVGIIGANGSGKSTLLRSLAGVYPLKAGSITVIGQIGTLLDMGLGFELESTGRENIYYRGMAMGFSRQQIAAAEQQIVDFAGLGDFIDLPMLTYSSGMYVRLGFAVSTQFMPDILLVDEVFGAGDAAFAGKAVERMLKLVEASGIMMLATHDLPLVDRVCSRVIWLNRGVIIQDGKPLDVLPAFSRFMSTGEPPAGSEPKA